MSGTVTPFGPATWNPADKGSSITLSNGNLTCRQSSGGAGSVRATVSCPINPGAKLYWEVTLTAQPVFPNVIGVAVNVVDLSGASSAFYTQGGTGAFVAGSGPVIWVDGYNLSYPLSPANQGDVVCVALDSTNSNNQMIWFRVNGGTWVPTDPASGSGGVALSQISLSYFPCDFPQNTNAQDTVNFGPTMKYAIPSGFTLFNPAPSIAMPSALILA